VILLLKYRDVYDMPLVVFNQIRRVVGIVCDVIQQTAHPRKSGLPLYKRTTKKS
jgi:transposase-like protein